MTDLATFFNEEAPLEHDIFGNFEYTVIKHGPYSVQQPVIQLKPANRIGDHLYTVADFRERDGADEQVLKPLASNETSHPRTWARSTQLGNYIGIQQPPTHNLTARTGIAERLASISIWR